MKNVIVSTSEEEPETLLNHPANYKKHTEDQAEAMTAILADVGFVSEVLVNKRTMRILDGHMRVEIAKINGTKIPVRFIDIPEEEEAKYLAVIDPSARLAKVQRIKFDKIINASFSNATALSVLKSTVPPLPKAKVKKPKEPEPAEPEPVKELGDSFLSILDDIPTSDEPLPIMVDELAESDAKFLPVLVGDVSFLVSSQEYGAWEQALRVECQDSEPVMLQTILKRLGVGDDVPQ